MIKDIKKKFPIFSKKPELIFLDTAASALKPESVIKTISDCMLMNILIFIEGFIH